MVNDKRFTTLNCVSKLCRLWKPRVWGNPGHLHSRFLRPASGCKPLLLLWMLRLPGTRCLGRRSQGISFHQQMSLSSISVTSSVLVRCENCKPICSVHICPTLPPMPAADGSWPTWRTKSEKFARKRRRSEAVLGRQVLAFYPLPIISSESLM